MRLMTFARPARILLSAMAAACLAIDLAAGPAVAAATWTIKPGGAVTFRQATRAAIQDTRSGTVIVCADVTLSGMLKSGSGLNGTSAGSVSGGAITNCQDGVQLPWKITMLGLPWHLNLRSYDGSTGLVHGTISHLEIRAANVGCRFVLDGTRGGASDGMVNFTYSDRTHRVEISRGNLHIFTVNGCEGLVADEDPASLTASFTVTPAPSITSP